MLTNTEYLISWLQDRFKFILEDSSELSQIFCSNEFVRKFDDETQFVISETRLKEILETHTIIETI